MATVERRIAFLIEESPGVWRFHVQRGDVNGSDPIDRGLGHLHSEDLIDGNRIFYSNGNASSHSLETVKLTPGTFLGRNYSDDLDALSSVEVGEVLGFTRGDTFPTVFADNDAINVVQRHYYTGGGMEEWFYYDRTRDVWLSDRVIEMTFSGPNGLSSGSAPVIPSGGAVSDTYGYFSSDELMIVGFRFAQRSAPSSDMAIVVRYGTTNITTYAVLSALQFQRNASSGRIPANEWVNLVLTGGDITSSYHIQLVTRRVFDTV